MVWTSLQRFAKMGIDFVSGIILARLLTPFDYGCIGMLSIFMVLADTFIDSGFGSALIQKKNPTQTDYSTIFFWNLGMSFVLYGILYVSAPAISSFYKIPILCDVLRVQGLVLFIHALNIIQRNQLKKKMNFKILAIVSLLSSSVSLAVTIIMAYHGCGVWSLVAMNLVSSAIPSLIFWFYVRWRPIWTFSWKSFRELFSFGVYMFLTHLVNKFGAKLSQVLIGKIYNPSTLGYFTKAASTESLASHSVSSMLTQITYPLYAQIQDDKKTLGNVISKLTKSIAFITFPLMFILMMTAKPIFILLYSTRWVACIPYFQVLCLVGLSECLQSINTQSIAAIGKSRTMFKWSVIKRTTGSTFVIGGLLLWGMKGLLAGYVIYNWLCYAVNVGLVSKYIGYKWHQQLMDLLPVTILSIIVAGICYFGVSMLHLSLYTDGIAKFTLYVILYLGMSMTMKLEAFEYTISLIPSRFKFWRKRNRD